VGDRWDGGQLLMTRDEEWKKFESGNARTFATDAAPASLLGLLADDELVYACRCQWCALKNRK